MNSLVQKENFQEESKVQVLLFAGLFQVCREKVVGARYRHQLPRLFTRLSSAWDFEIAMHCIALQST